jgi:hypothetical protein
LALICEAVLDSGGDKHLLVPESLILSIDSICDICYCKGSRAARASSRVGPSRVELAFLLVTLMCRAEPSRASSLSTLPGT